jgi:hypothetical protein
MNHFSLHSALDAFAVFTEDRYRRTPEPCRLRSPLPLDCFSPLPALPASPPRRGLWSAPSPLPSRPDDRMSVFATPARAARRGTMLLVPPWKIGSLGLVSGYTDLLAEAGFDVWLVCPPHHLHRTEPGARSGEGFVSLDLARLSRAFEQLVLELRVCVALAALRGPVGLLGLSLGGLAGALAATSPERLDFVALVAPTNLRLALEHTAIGRRYRRLAQRASSRWPSGEELAAALAPFDPSSRSPTTRRLFIGAGRHDLIAPPQGALDLSRAWGVVPRLYPRGHLSLLLLCRALRRDLRAFVASGGLHSSEEGASFPAP